MSDDDRKTDTGAKKKKNTAGKIITREKVTRNHAREYPGQVEYLGVEVGEVGHDKDEDGLDDAGVLRETGDEAREEAPDDADDGAAEGDDEERGEALGVVRRQDRVALGRDLGVHLEHVIQDLRRVHRKKRRRKKKTQL
jgi:hypothetical protein